MNPLNPIPYTDVLSEVSEHSSNVDPLCREPVIVQNRRSKKKRLALYIVCFLFLVLLSYLAFAVFELQKLSKAEVMFPPLGGHFPIKYLRISNPQVTFRSLSVPSLCEDDVDFELQADLDR